jgi:hypothetical protein
MSIPWHSDHLRHLHEALKSEEAFARREHDRIAGLPLADRTALGAAWSGVRFEAEPSWRRGEIQVVVRGTLHEGIGPGDRVRIGALEGRVRGLDIAGDRGVAELAVRGTEEDLEREGAAGVVDRVFDPGTLIRYRQALERADALEDSAVKTALLEGPTPFEPLEPAPLRGSGLNDAQRHAARLALDAEALALLHGPPGTGKTRTLVAILRSLSERALALADSNAAVDHLAVTASEAGLDVVRVGAVYRMSGPAAALSLDARVTTGPHGEALAALDRDISYARKAGGPTLWTLLDARRELLQTARDHLLTSADVIACTFGTLVTRAASFPPVHTAVVDEVTQAVEPALWTAVPFVQRLILAGDPHQLGPVVLEPGNPLEQGVMDRLIAIGTPAPMLEVQHRMHGAIQDLVEDVYGDSYVPHDSVATHTTEALAALGWGPVLGIDTAGAGAEARDPVSHSTYEPLEVRLVGRVLETLVQAGVPPDAIGVIAPYSAQVARLAALPGARDVEVATVNAFQGREKSVVVVSFTRSNPDGALGFVADRRRLTVALTRAKHLLVAVGDSVTLGGHPAFADLFARLELADALQSVWEPPWSDALEP